MKETRCLMGMPITIEIVDPKAEAEALGEIFSYFARIDQTFSTYKPTSEISLVNAGLVREEHMSSDMRAIFSLAKETKQATHGYFDMRTPFGGYDPSGIVKGWAIRGAADLLDARGYKNFYINAGGDIEVRGKNEEGRLWSVGIQDPFNNATIVKTLYLTDRGIATSGTYTRGHHIYNPKRSDLSFDDLVSLTVIAPDVYEADRFATAAFAMGKKGIMFIESLEGYEGYAIYKNGSATLTSNFHRYTTLHD